MPDSYAAVRRAVTTLAALGMAFYARGDDAPAPAVLVLAKPLSVEFVRLEADIDVEAEDPLPYVMELYRAKIRIERVVAGALHPPKDIVVELSQIRGQTSVDLRRAKQIYIVLVKSENGFVSRSRTSWGIPQRVACLRRSEVVDTDLDRRFKELEGPLVGCVWL
jgi:hypothetical protein